MNSALEKRLKKHIHAQPHALRIVPAPGWKDICEDELRSILGSFTQNGKFPAIQEDDPEGLGVRNLDFRQMLEIPERLLTAQACLWKILDKHVGSFGDLTRALENLEIELYLPEKAAVGLKVQSFQSQLYHEGKLFEIISGFLQEKSLTVGDEAPFHLLAEQRGNRFCLFLALGPYPLHHRRYKPAARHGAPLQECLAAAALRWTMQLQGDWQPDHLVIPFAGSGTLLFESWMLLGRMPASLWNPNAYMEQLPATPLATQRSIRKRLIEAMPTRLPPALLIEKDSTIAQGLSTHIESFKKPLGSSMTATAICADVFRTPLPDASRILAPLNPPYGIRLEQAGKIRPADFYRQLGAFLKKWPQKNQDLRGFVLIPDEDALNAMRQELRPESIQAIQSFSQGGQHIRCLAFKTP